MSIKKSNTAIKGKKHNQQGKQNLQSSSEVSQKSKPGQEKKSFKKPKSSAKENKTFNQPKKQNSGKQFQNKISDSDKKLKRKSMDTQSSENKTKKFKKETKMEVENSNDSDENSVEEMEIEEENSPSDIKTVNEDQPKVGDKKQSKSNEENPNATKKELKLQRKMNKKNSEVTIPLMKMYSDLNSKKTTAGRREELCDEVVSMTKGKMLELVRAHDTVRVFECILLHGKNRHKLAMFDELKENITDLAMCKYAKFIPIKMMNYGSKEQKLHIFGKLKGNVAKLLKHKEAAEVVELAYNDHANSSERSAIVQELYGSYFALFKSPNIKSLEDAIKENPAKKFVYMENLQTLLTSLIKKDLNKLSIVQHVLLEYLHQLLDSASDQSEQLQNLVDLLKERLVCMLHTRTGVKVAMQILWNSSARDRKMIIRSMKSAVNNVATNEHGHLFVMSLLDSVDDIVLLEKFIIKELSENCLQVAQNKHGRHVLLYAIVRRDPLFFNKQFLALLTPGDTNRFSKKDADMRNQQLAEYFSPMLLKLVKEHFEDLIADNGTILLLVEILCNCVDPTVGTTLSEAYDPLFNALQMEYQPGETDTKKFSIESPVVHILLRKLTKKSKLFRDGIVEKIPGNSIRSWTGCNKGCFFLLSLWETNEPSLRTFLSRELKSICPKLKSSEFPGAELLYNSITNNV